MNKYHKFQIGVDFYFFLEPFSSSCLRAYLRKPSHPFLRLIAAYAKHPGTNPVPFLSIAPSSRDLWLLGQGNLLTK